MSQLGVVILVAIEAKNAGIAEVTASIFNEISGLKDKHSGSCYCLSWPERKDRLKNKRWFYKKFHAENQF